LLDTTVGAGQLDPGTMRRKRITRDWVGGVKCGQRTR